MWIRATSGVLVNTNHIRRIYNTGGSVIADFSSEAEDQEELFSAEEDSLCQQYLNALYARLTDAEPADGGCHS